MEAKKSLIFGLAISLLLFASCKSNDRFYANIREHESCLISCDITSSNKQTITIVDKKDYVRFVFEKFGEPWSDDILIKSIKTRTPVSVGRNLYFELYGQQVIPQARIDSLLMLGVERLFEVHSSFRLLTPQIPNITIMEDYYLKKRLFDRKFLLQQDCESGYYFILE